MNKVLIKKTFVVRNKNCLNFKKLRLSMDLTQLQLAKLLKLQRHTIYHYETGRRCPSVKVCKRYIELADKQGFSITLDYLRPEL
jgi:DNA-binding XRE family transcriptional regulator